MKKTILITGSTDGIGKLAAAKLAGKGHKIYIHGRNFSKLSETISEISEATENENIKGFKADFSDLDSVKQMVNQIKAEVSSIDVLINNAGVFKSPVLLNKDGHNIRFVVNYLSPYLLTKKIIPLLHKSNNPRIVNLSSAAQAPVSHDALLGKTQLSVGDAYAQSKLAFTMWSFHLAKQFKDIAVIAVNPGSLLNTKMAIEAYGQHWSSADKGANILYDLAVSEDYRNDTGKYFDNDKGNFGEAHQDAYDETKINELIKITEEIMSE